MRTGIGLAVDGVGPFINRIEKFDKDISKELKAQIRKAAGPAMREARNSYPSVGLTNWGAWYDSGRKRDLSYQIGEVRKGIRLRQSKIKDRAMRSKVVGFGYTITQVNPGGAIIELAGKKSSDRFSLAINAKHGMVSKVPRFITSAYYSVVPGVRADIEALVKAAMRKVGV